MLTLVPAVTGGIHLLCLGAHPDDIEIGAGGTVLRLAGAGSISAATWVVFSGTAERVLEGTRSAEAFLEGVVGRTITFHDTRDGYFPASFAQLKDAFEALKASVRPDLVLMPRADDAHQDHRLVAELARTTFRDHVLLEYEIAKFDADLRPPNAYVALDEALLARKIELIGAAFGSQHGLDLVRSRGIPGPGPDSRDRGRGRSEVRRGIPRPQAPAGRPSPQERPVRARRWRRQGGHGREVAGHQPARRPAGRPDLRLGRDPRSRVVAHRPPAAPVACRLVHLWRVLGPIGLRILREAPPGTCGSCLSPVEGWSFLCPYCGADVRESAQGSWK